jgi:hypothetical protein
MRSHMKTDTIQYGKYEHYKNKKHYELIGIARHSETHEEMVIYKALYTCEQFGHHQVWVRPKKMFFENIIHNGATIPRFKYISE